MSDETNTTIANYNQHAAVYAARLGRASLKRELDGFAALLFSGACVADVGSGPGMHSRALAARGLQMIVLDLSAALLRYAHAAGLDELVQADMRVLPFGVGALDGVWACASLLHLSKADMPGTFAELRRVVRRDGVLYVSVKEGDGTAWVSHPQCGTRFFAYYQPDELDTLLAAGWQIVDAHTNPGTSHRWLNRLCLAV